MKDFNLFLNISWQSGQNCHLSNFFPSTNFSRFSRLQERALDLILTSYVALSCSTNVARAEVEVSNCEGVVERVAGNTCSNLTVLQLTWCMGCLSVRSSPVAVVHQRSSYSTAGGGGPGGFMSRLARQLMWAGLVMGLSAAALLYVCVQW